MTVVRCHMGAWVVAGAQVLAVVSAASGAVTQPPSSFNEVVELAPADYRHRMVQNLSLAEANRDELLRALAQAPPEQREAIAFLIANMPENDLTTLSADFLLRNTALAYEGRAKSPWAAAVPMEIFLNDVLPYANLNERRDDWRKDFMMRFAPLVKDCKTAGEAAQVLNREIFKALNVAYHATKRRKPDQSPYESTEIGFASCSGLSILLVDACRAVGVPARVAGTPMWVDKSGNHTWVEVWDGQWRFVGAAEPGAFNAAWFNAPAAKADASKPEHKIYAASFRHTDLPFMLTWKPGDTSCSAVDVTGYYVQRRNLNVRVLDAAGASAPGTIQVRQGDRLIAQAEGTSADFELAADADYVVRAMLPPGQGGVRSAESRVHLARDADLPVELRAIVAGERASPSSEQSTHAPVDALKQWLVLPRDSRPALVSQGFAAAPLTKAQAEEARALLWEDHAAAIRAMRQKEWDDEKITLDGRTLRLKMRAFGSKPVGGWSLYISMHGGGNAPAKVNDQQWANQITLYEPPHSLVIAPRAPTDTWNLWHEPHIDRLFGRLIEDAIVLGDVNPDRIYLMGYSAGGDGVYQLAPRTADRFAAASMMAGHPNDASPLNLRNIGFTIHVGALDDGYDRNKRAAEWGEQLNTLHEADPEGYPHLVQLHEGRPHWMNKEDSVALEWMAGFTRTLTPKRVVWKQGGNVQVNRFYWLEMPADQAKAGQLVIAERRGQEIIIEKAEGVKTLTVLLRDDMLDLDQPVTVLMNGRELFKGIVPRTAMSLAETLDQRGDPRAMFAGHVSVQLESAK